MRIKYSMKHMIKIVHSKKYMFQLLFRESAIIFSICQ